jgi:K(+)-stimulated pyrophosphate-energized sodium pump
VTVRRRLGTLLTLISGCWLFASPIWAATEAVELPPFQSHDIAVLIIVLGTALLAILYGIYLIRRVLSEPAGTEAMQRVAIAVREGAFAYLRQQFRLMRFFVLILAFLLLVVYSQVPEYGPALAAGTAIAFLMGVAASYGAGVVGMWMAVNGNVRVAYAALRSFREALRIAFQAGTVSGMATVALGLLGATLIFLAFREKAMFVLVGFGFGGCLAALFMRVGGGIYTKAADVGADLVGKVEAGIPEDDPRNPATIADNVGDNVGDCAGMAADVFESYEVTLVAAILLGYGALASVGKEHVMQLILYPLLVRGVGVIASILGTAMVRAKDEERIDPMQPINVGFWTAAILSVIGFWLVSYFYLGNMANWWKFALACTIGIALTQVIGWLTQYFTGTEYRPVKDIAQSSRTGTATMILEGFSVGLESSVWAIVAIALTIFLSILLFPGDFALSAYAVALSGLGLLATTGFVLAMDTYGPISDNANGIFEMSGALRDAEARGNERAARIVAQLDAVGNTVKALTKGFAIATAVIAAVSLFRSFTEATGLVAHGAQGLGIRIDQPEVFIGVLLGAAVPFLFSAFAIRAVSRAAFQLVEEVRRQFRTIPGILEGKATPDYSRAVAISTAAAQRELLSPGILAIASPILVGFALGFADPKMGAAALGGFLGGAIVSGQLLAVLMANSGGAWDNAKKLIEAGLFGGKGTEYHKSAVVCDTVGDPFKDTAGPALNPLIKVMNLVGILIAPILVQPIDALVRFLIVAVMVAALAGAVAWSKRTAVLEIAEPVPASKSQA